MKFVTSPVRLFFFFFLMNSLISCVYKEVKIVKLENVAIKQLSSQGIKAEVFLKVSNPNNYDISFVDSDLDILINDKPVGKANIREKILLPKKTEDVHRVNVETSFEKLGSGVLATIGSVFLSNSLKLGVRGSVTVKTFLFRKKINVELNEKVGYTGK